MPVGPAAERYRTALRGPHGAGHPGQDGAADAVCARLRLRPGGPPGRSGRGRRLVPLGPSWTWPWGSDVPVTIDGGAAVADFTLGEGEEASFVLRRARPADRRPALPTGRPDATCSRDGRATGTAGCPKCTYRGRWREVVHRSALVAQAADLRAHRGHRGRPDLRPARGARRHPELGLPLHLDPRRRLHALRLAADRLHRGGRRLHGLPGRAAWPRSQPRRVAADPVRRRRPSTTSTRRSSTTSTATGARGRSGSATPPSGQLQLDIYGELMDAVYLYNKYGAPISYDLWVTLRRLVNWVCDNWQREDEGIWETRGGRRHWVYSKLMCWVALDRALRLADKRSFPADRDRWLQRPGRDLRGHHGPRVERQAPGVHAGLRQRHPGRQRAHDAPGVLRGPERPEDAGHDGRDQPVARARGAWWPTASCTATTAWPAPTGSPGDEGTFNICTFWLVEALTRAGEARPVPTGRGPAHVREHARLRQPPGPVRRGDLDDRGGARQLPAGLHPSGADQRRRSTSIGHWTGCNEGIEKNACRRPRRQRAGHVKPGAFPPPLRPAR